MCQISDKIKFCTCAATSVNRLKHYWIWHQFNKNKFTMIVGEIMLPDFIVNPDFAKNKKILSNRLNEIDAFDAALEFKNKDLLEIVIDHKIPHAHKSTYLFEFKKDSWRSVKYDPFRIAAHHDEANSGKIKNALKRINNK